MVLCVISKLDFILFGWVGSEGMALTTGSGNEEVSSSNESYVDGGLEADDEGVAWPHFGLQAKTYRQRMTLWKSENKEKGKIFALAK